MPRVARGGGVVVASLSASDDEDHVLSMGSGRGQDDDSSLGATFESYMSACGMLGDDIARDAVFSRGLARVRDFLSGQQQGGDASCCLICLGTIKPTEAVWSCTDSCCAIFHLPCIQEWAKQQVDAAVLRAMSRLGVFPNAEKDARAAAEWACPKCRHAYHNRAIPREYRCFCGKALDPEWDPWRPPHSCGELCGRPLGGAAGGGDGGAGGCDHTCLLLCHPGPCPPCPLVVSTSCYCGTVTARRRCGHHEFTCGGACGAELPCGHACEEVCHEGEHPACPKVGRYACACGAEHRTLPCAERDFHCTRVCGKALPCGRHKCEAVCHAGPCGGCPFSGPRTCPCGKREHTDLTCTDKVPTCGETCGKLLPCGRHTCQERCHYGECSKTCRELVDKTCRCGKTQRSVPCHQELICDRRCTSTRACGRHPCKRRCCDGDCPPCEETCGRKLRCGNHRCPAPCHSDACRPCPLTITYACACGSGRWTLPCGAESRAIAPRCYSPCPVPAICRHAAARAPHRCHFGPCPTCDLPCGTGLPCGHACGAAGCHDPSPPPVPSFQPPSAPRVQLAWGAEEGVGAAGGRGSGSGARGAGARAGGKEQQPKGKAAAASQQQAAADAGVPPAQQAAQAARDLAASLPPGAPSPCPPCAAPVPVTCLGGHSTVSMACHAVTAFSCGAACGRPLPCGNHTCSLACHAVPDQPSSNNGSSGRAIPCETCTRPCSKGGSARGCDHPCPLACHPGPCPECTVSVRSPCNCWKTTLQLPCPRLLAAQRQQAAAGSAAGPAAEEDPLCCGKPCHRQLPHCPHPCRALCHRGPCPDAEGCKEEVTVRCECKRLREKWACARVQAALAAAGKGRMYDAGTPLRLLACDAQCKEQQQQAQQQRPAAEPAAAAAPPGRGSSSAQAAAVASAATAAVAATPPTDSQQQAAAAAGGKPRTSKAAERAAAAEAKAAEKQRQERMRKLRLAAVWMAIGLVGALLAFLAYLMLGQLDNWARDKYQPGH